MDSYKKKAHDNLSLLLWMSIILIYCDKNKIPNDDIIDLYETSRIFYLFQKHQEKLTEKQLWEA